MTGTSGAERATPQGRSRAGDMAHDPNRKDSRAEAQLVETAAKPAIVPARLRKSGKTVVLSLRTLKFEQCCPLRVEAAAPCMKRSCEA